MKKLFAALLVAASLTACTTEADQVNKNLAVNAEQFRVQRHIVVVNGITDEYLLEVVGKCSVENQGGFMEVICKTGPGDDEYYRHLISRSDNTLMVVEQLEPIPVDAYRTQVVFRPEALVPSIDLDTSANEEN